MPQVDGFDYAYEYKAIFRAQSGIGRAVDILATWLNGNKMCVNISKTKIMKMKRKLRASLNNQCLPNLRSQKALVMIVYGLSNLDKIC